MKKSNLLRLAAFSAALTLFGANLSAQAQPTTKAKTQGQKQPRKNPAVKHAEDVLGKPLTPAQKTAVRAAQKERLKAVKPIQEKYKATVAKALGLTVAQYEAREKALRQKKAH